jgi:hypothetical protein
MNHGAVPVGHSGAVSTDQVVVAKDSCTSCHRENFTYHSIALGKDIALTTPHGGNAIGYPVTGGQWTWAGWSEDKWKQHKLPKNASDYDSKGQFHILHVSNGKPHERVACSDCHTAGFDPAKVRVGVQESCAACHNPNPDAAIASTGRLAAGTQCTSCHQQHIQGKDPLALVRARQVNAARQN